MPAPATSLRRTKIIFTLGPATESEATLEKMIGGGADIVRLNMAHATHDWTRLVIRRIRAVSARLGRDVAIMMDIKGPEIRTGDLAAPIELTAGEIFDFTVRPGLAGESGGGAEEIRSVGVNYQNLVNDIALGDTVLVDNGLLRLEVLEKNDARIRCRVLIPGELKSRRHINLPGVKVNLPSFTEKDRGDTTVGLEEGIDFVALSFVREAKDIELLRTFLAEKKSKARIIAKIEDQSAIAHLDDIVRACDALMVARGDLGIECPFEDLPVIQRRAVRACLAQGRPVIVATHMLESMIEQSVPTRAEITDVANAVYELADCVMLSGETTIGKYPLECVQMLDIISRRIEREVDDNRIEPAVFTGERMKVLHSAVVLANRIPRSKILTFTRHGFMAHGLAALRPVHSPV
ncbi:MAG: Pyruvate kinase, partial [Verrucomicrobiota bacterium]